MAEVTADRAIGQQIEAVDAAIAARSGPPTSGCLASSSRTAVASTGAPCSRSSPGRLGSTQPAKSQPRATPSRAPGTISARRRDRVGRSPPAHLGVIPEPTRRSRVDAKLQRGGGQARPNLRRGATLKNMPVGRASAPAFCYPPRVAERLRSGCANVLQHAAPPGAQSFAGVARALNAPSWLRTCSAPRGALRARKSWDRVRTCEG